MVGQKSCTSSAANHKGKAKAVRSRPGQEQLLFLPTLALGLAAESEYCTKYMKAQSWIFRIYEIEY
jgi:hypothetical protein